MMATTAFQLPTNNSKYFMNPQADQSPPEAYLYGTGANTTSSPMAQTPPSTNVSPTNYHVHIRQLRQPRQPLYVPAALRPTDLPTRPTNIPKRPSAPDTPPASKDNSFDSGKSNLSDSVGNVGLPSSGVGEEESLEQLQQKLSRSASEGLKDALGEVTGPPTTAHWKPDASATGCAVCRNTFTWWFRRHHCRRCGDVICIDHSANKVPLDQNARYHPDGELSKACDPCFKEWTIVEKLRHSRVESISQLQNNAQASNQPALAIPQQPKPSQEGPVGSVARSHREREEGMVWSTF